MNFLFSVRAALAGGLGETAIAAAIAPAQREEEPPPSDLRCVNPECDLFELRLEADEVAPTPGRQPDRCASCGRQLGEYQPKG